MDERPSNFVDYATLAAAIVGPVAAFLSTRWAIKRGEKSRFDLHIAWRDFGPNAYIEEAPLLHIHNKGANSIHVTDVRFFAGVFKRRPIAATALDYEDPTELHFPYEIEPGKSRSLRLDQYQITRIHGEQIQTHRWEDRLRRSSIWLRVQTADGSRKMVNAMEALPWHLRPKWSKVSDE